MQINPVVFGGGKRPLAKNSFWPIASLRLDLFLAAMCDFEPMLLVVGDSRDQSGGAIVGGLDFSARMPTGLLSRREPISAS